MKYGLITTEYGKIPEGEPVFILRAQDRLAANAIRCYAALLTAAGDDKGYQECLEIAATFDKWPKKKMPD